MRIQIIYFSACESPKAAHALRARSHSFSAATGLIIVWFRRPTDLPSLQRLSFHLLGPAATAGKRTVEAFLTLRALVGIESPGFGYLRERCRRPWLGGTVHLRVDCNLGNGVACCQRCTTTVVFQDQHGLYEDRHSSGMCHTECARGR